MAKNPQLEMMRAALKATGMSEEQIKQALEAQEAAMNAFSACKDDIVDAQNAYLKAADALEYESCFELSQNPSIDTNDQWAIACGADLAYYRGDILNDLTSDTDEDTCKEMLSEQWGIDNKKDFTEMAESLLDGRHSKIYRQLAEGEEVEGFEEEAENLEEALEVFEEDEMIEEDEIPDMLAWDLGRLINISRFAYDAKILNREEALHYIRKAAALMQKTYGSWKEMSVAYQLGRYTWGGDDVYEELNDGMDDLLTEEDSPWVKMPFDMKISFKG
jgi:hypothetical protein